MWGKIFSFFSEWHVHFIPKKLIVNTSEIVQMCCMVNPKHYTGWTIKIYHYWNGVFIRQFGDIEVYQNTANLSLSYSEYTDTGEYVCSMNIHEAIFTSAVSLHVLGNLLLFCCIVYDILIFLIFVNGNSSTLKERVKIW